MTSVSRALGVLEYIAAQPRTLTEIAAHAEVHKSSASRLMRTLIDHGFARVHQGKYAVGFGMISLVNEALDAIDLRTIARPHLLRLSKTFGHTLHLAQFAEDQVVYVDKVEGPGSLRMASKIGQPALLHTSAVAKAILAHLGRSEVDRLIAGAPLDRYTPTTITTRPLLDRELDRTRERGWAEDDAEYESWLNCVAAPIFDGRGRPVGSVSITALRMLAPLDALRDMVPDLRTSVATISADLGWSAPEVSPPEGSAPGTPVPGTSGNEERV